MRKVVLLLLPFLISITAFHSAKDITITGTVTDESGNPLSATVHAGKVFAVTDAKGHYQILINENEKYLVFSSVGFADQKIKIDSKKIIDIKMKSSATAMLAEVAVGYGTEKRRMLTGAVAGVVVSPSPRDKGFYEQDYNTEDYGHITEDRFRKVSDDPLSTFSIDVDAASYSNLRRFLQSN